MKYLLHVPVEQYGFVSAELETQNIEILSQHYKEIARAFKPQKGLERKEWNKALDSLGLGLTCPVEAFEAMSEVQKWTYHEFEKMIVRINGKPLKMTSDGVVAQEED